MTMGIRTAVMAGLEAPKWSAGCRRSPIKKAGDMGCLLRWGADYGMAGRNKRRVPVDIEPLVKQWIKPRLPFVARVMDCYQCCGFWCGLGLGLALLGHDPLVVFAAGCAGSFLAQLGWLVLDSLERYAKGA